MHAQRAPKKAAKPFRIAVHGHLIIGRAAHASLHSLGLI
jgi:DNA repair protein RadC